MASRAKVVTWLLNGDPSIRWQAMRDLTDAPADAIAAERSRVAKEGWGAALLARQTGDGHWNDATEHGWMTTTDALQLLRDLGADPADEKVRDAIGRVTGRITWWQLDGRPFFDGETEACINGRILATGAYFGAAVEPLRPAGRAARGRRLELRGAGERTLLVPLDDLRLGRPAGIRDGARAAAAVTDARARAEHYLLERRMLRSLSTGEVIRRQLGRASCFRPCGTTMCCAASTICAVPASSPMSASPKRWRWWSKSAGC